MGKGFRMERAPTTDHPTCLLFATGSGISPIKALIESNELQVRMHVTMYAIDSMSALIVNTMVNSVHGADRPARTGCMPC